MTEVSSLTGFPEIMDGRVKTLHPKVHGALLGRAGTDDAVMREQGIEPIDILVINLYPFAETIARTDCRYEDAIENIDVAVRRCCAPPPRTTRASPCSSTRRTTRAHSRSCAADSVTEATRRRLAAKAFGHTAQYDSLVSGWLRLQQGDTEFPDVLAAGFRKKQDLRYGENPHQAAAFYADPLAAGASVAAARQLQGKELSYNNIADADTAIECVRQFEDDGLRDRQARESLRRRAGGQPARGLPRAYEPDATSAFGGIIAFNRPLDAETAAAILERQFVEVIAAPSCEAGAREALARQSRTSACWRPGRLASASPAASELKSVAGGLLVQSRDDGAVGAADLKTVTRRAPDASELADLLFAWRVCKFVKSNAIVFAKDGRTVGIGAGQSSRVVSTRIAAMKAADARLAVAGSVMASDAFFPFRDGLDAAAELGIRAVIQPGGSMRDAEVIAAADERGIAMVFTGMRHFRH